MEGAAAGQLSSAQKDELMDQVKQQIAIATAQELLTVRINILIFRGQIIFIFFTFFKICSFLQCFRK
jgi:hypothetical protein